MSINSLTFPPKETWLLLCMMVSLVVVCVTSLLIGYDILVSNFYRRRRRFAAAAFVCGAWALADLIFLWTPLHGNVQLQFWSYLPAAAGILIVTAFHWRNLHRHGLKLRKSALGHCIAVVVLSILYALIFFLAR